MQCPACASDKTRVLDTRPCKGDVVRRRVCQACGHRFSTAERITAEYMRVRKRDGRIEPFSRAKLIKGITKAAGGYTISPEDMTVYVDRVIQVLQPDAPSLPVNSSDLGALVLQQLHNDSLTDVVRVRYAMVLLGNTNGGRGFRKIDDFLAWLRDEYGEPRVVRPGETPSTVVKRGGRREPFEVRKLASSIGIAAKGRGNDAEVYSLANRIAANVQRELRGQALVTSSQIAAEALKILCKQDKLAYLRYASPVKQYQSVDDFWLDASAAEADEL